MNWRIQLRQAMMRHFSETDIRALCFDLGVDYDTLSGDNKTEKIISLIEYADQTNDLPRLISYCSHYRPNVPWDQISEAAKREQKNVNPQMRVTAIIAVVVVLIITGVFIVFRYLIPNGDGDDVTATIMTVPEEKPISTSIIATTVAETAPQPTLTEMTQPTSKPEQTITPMPAILYSSSDRFHLGDEEVRDWALLYGRCLEIDFIEEFSTRRLLLRLQTFGAEAQNSISLNGRAVAILPSQKTVSSDPEARPNEWTNDVEIPISTEAIVEGVNTLAICAELVPDPDFSGDLDDYQVRSIRLIAE